MLPTCRARQKKNGVPKIRIKYLFLCHFGDVSIAKGVPPISSHRGVQLSPIICRPTTNRPRPVNRFLHTIWAPSKYRQTRDKTLPDDLINSSCSLDNKKKKNKFVVPVGVVLLLLLLFSVVGGGGGEEEEEQRRRRTRDEARGGGVNSSSDGGGRAGRDREAQQQYQQQQQQQRRSNQSTREVKESEESGHNEEGETTRALDLMRLWWSAILPNHNDDKAAEEDNNNYHNFDDHQHQHHQLEQELNDDGPLLTAATKLHWLLLNISKTTTMGWPEWLQPHIDSFVLWVNGLLEYWHLGYLEYIVWLLLPIFIVFVLPIVFLFFSYGCVIFLRIYKHRNRIREAYASSVWDGARASIASFWEGVGYLWHGYELHGLENIPDEGPAMIVAYHGPTPIDLYYVIAKGILYKKRTIHCVADKFVFKIPGWSMICKVFCMTPGTVEDCVATLSQGHVLIIAPGGVREALFSNPVTYELMWGRRLGFAKVVLNSGAPVIPMFTENCREAFRTPRWARRLTRPIYERTRLPVCPIYGGFPVKMITHLGTPLTFVDDVFDQPLSAEQIKRTVRDAVDALIQRHQHLPGGICRAMFQRIRAKRTKPEPDDAVEARKQWRKRHRRRSSNDQQQQNVTVTDLSRIVVGELSPCHDELVEVPLLLNHQQGKDVGRHHQQRLGTVDGEDLDQE
uniref:Phospholipid/glycerol acyltransferase domain-containing protein n=1 Tax=Globodera rostochiensis TaxID=31243 RepID=A0A914I8X8_GLORO